MRTTVNRRAACATRKSKRLLVVGKLTAYQAALERNDERVFSLIAAGHPSVVNMVPEHQAHAASLASVLKHVKSYKSPFVRVDELAHIDIDREKFDLILVVGGDGTVLDVSHQTRSTPILGVKSAPRSRAHFCLANTQTLPALLDAVNNQRFQPLSIMRLKAFIDGKRVGPDVLNEVFFESTTSTTSYIVRVGDKREEQQSDGIFFAAAAGSTAWMRAYGSEIVPITERSIQYLVRGADINPEQPFTLLHGFATDDSSLSVTSKNADAKVAVDGRRNLLPIGRGEKLVIRPSENDLRIFADPRCNERYLADQAARFPSRQPSRH
jgi:NAD kinase